MPTRKNFRPSALVSPEPPAHPPEQDVPADVRDRLSPVVMNVYSSGDFHRVDMRTIAREAGMSFRTIYRYFVDKETLLFWFIDHWLKGLYPAALMPLDGNAEMRTKLLGVLTAHFAFYEENPNVGRIIFMTVPLERWMRDPSYAQRELIMRMLHEIKEGQQRGELRRDLDSLMMFDAFSALFNRAFLMWEYRGRRYSLTGQAAPLLSILWNGIAAVAPPSKPIASTHTPSRKRAAG